MLKTLLFILSTITFFMLGIVAEPAHASCITTFANGMAFTNCTPEGGFQDGYNAATNNGATIANGFAMAAQMNQTEAIINEMRAARGVPPCTMRPLRGWFTGEPAC